jgi:hypothetical protein
MPALQPIFVNLLQEPWAQFIGHPKTAANDEFGQWILNGHHFLPNSYLLQNPGKVQPGMNGDEKWIKTETS